MANLASIFPFFIVADLKAAVSFYTNKLGFEVRYTGPDDGPYWAIVGRDDISIMLKKITDDVKPVPNHTLHEWAPWDAYIYVPNPDSLFEEYRAAGIEFRQPLKDNSDRMRGFEVMDADGYVLFFGCPLPQEKLPVRSIDLKKMSPQLPVAHIERSIEFYTKKLGFSVDFRYEDFYAGIAKNGHSIHLKCSAPPENAKKNKDDLDITFSVDNIERLYEEILSQSIEIVQPLRNMPYGKEFYIADPDGNRIAFLEETRS
jgi:catechol 2,3-dioxygenase-like lactoylglutathione lyase family enzyme